ncbi:ATP-binding cassette domain-containing protein [Lysinibacillus xylanilyticus]|uniref:ATP-binding cassette domain-containing protein n=1 Tax=Lysinibacillus xylanilyticus TaxID=582475 RepID=UPI002B24716D|nr:ATP-binding cassette domain-containing protein [Lysinibacillus xylanilyticus]MEB2301551.1 ATP-binding cassette domain-containing protein [Lysinibacillus xylanilyticus]
MIHIENMKIKKKGEILLDNTNIVLKDKVVILGPHKSGKTALLQAICGKGKITSGQILLSDEFIKENNIGDQKGVFMYIPKDYSNFFKDLSVKHILTFFARNAEHSLLLKDGNIELNLKFKDLSNIQKLILFMDIGRKNNKKIFILDEPFVNLDLVETSIFKKIYSDHLNDKSVILTSNTYSHTILDFEQNLYIHNKKLIEEDPFVQIL